MACGDVLNPVCYFEQLGELLRNLVYMVLYFPISFINMLLNVVIYTVNSVISFILAVLGLLGSIVNFFVMTIGLLFFAPWTTLLLVGITLVLLLRIYKFLKDVHILGNSI